MRVVVIRAIICGTKFKEAPTMMVYLKTICAVCEGFFPGEQRRSAQQMVEST